MIHKFAKRAVPIAALTLAATLAGCSYSVDWSDEVEGVALSEFDTSGEAPDTIQLAGPDKIVITEGDGLSITLEGDDEAGDALRFDRDGDRLTIARDRDVYDGSGSALILITMPAPEALEIAGSGDIESATMASDAEIEIAGSGNVKVEAIAAEELDVSIAGSGDVYAAGTASVLDLSIAGNGNVRFGELTADTVSISIAGSGNVNLASNGSVDASVAGSGNINVTGSATCSVSTAGSGSLKCSPAEAEAAPAAPATADDATDDAEAE